MSNQRKRLAKYENKNQRYRGIFGEIRHDKQNRPEVLIKDIYPIYENGKKVPLRSKDGPTNSKGQQIATDHAWIPMTKSWIEVGRELFNGDIIEFNAVVKPYKIARDDILKQREDLWQNGLAQANLVYQKYQRQKQRELTRARIATIKMQKKTVKQLKLKVGLIVFLYLMVCYLLNIFLLIILNVISR